jgi:HK97 family phage major capsid protein
MGQLFCRCPGCGACGTAEGTHDVLFAGGSGSTVSGSPRCPACTAAGTARGSSAPLERRSQGGSVAPRQRLSARIGGIAETRRRSTVDEFKDMQQEAERLEARADRASELEQRLQVVEPDIYGPGGGGRHSWLADIARVTRRRASGDGGLQAAEKRLADSERYEHRKMDRRLRQLIAERELERALTGSAEEYIVFERWKAAGGKLFEKNDELRDLELRAASSTPGQGGYFEPPLWLIDAWSHSPRAGAAMAALWTQLPLPLHQGDTINVPVLAAGAGAGTTTQAGDGAPAGFRDPLDGTVQAKVETLAATLDTSMELMDMSPVSFDESFGQDISEDLATQTDGQLLLGNGANGTLNGVIPAGAFSSSTMLLLQSTNNSSSQTIVNGGTDITSSVYQMLSMLYSKFARYRGLPATHWVVNPDVWGILCGSADANNRPLVEPGRLVKALHGLPLVEDENLVSSFGGTTPPSIGISAGVVSPTAGNGGYAPVLLGRWSDLFWFASPPVVQVLPEVLSSTFQVRYRVSRYVASMPGRVQWGGVNQTFSGTDQGGGLKNGAAVGYAAFTNFTSNGPLQPAANGW